MRVSGQEEPRRRWLCLCPGEGARRLKAVCHLREHRGTRKLREIAEQTGISVPTLSMLERGRMVPTDTELTTLANVLKTPWWSLWESDGRFVAVEPDPVRSAEKAA
jgi:transcriptional regulator with XRE-family HTH domain